MTALATTLTTAQNIAQKLSLYGNAELWIPQLLPVTTHELLSVFPWNQMCHSVKFDVIPWHIMVDQNHSTKGYRTNKKQSSCMTIVPSRICNVESWRKHLPWEHSLHNTALVSQSTLVPCSTTPNNSLFEVQGGSNFPPVRSEMTSSIATSFKIV